jgi:malonyl-CoA O-methyltransferase
MSSAVIPDPELLRATQLDPKAWTRQARRCLEGGQTPWLNAQLAQRMAERLDWIKLDVRQVLQWQAMWGGGDEPLRARYPQAQHVWVEDVATDAARARLRTPWWAPWQAPRAQLLSPGAVPTQQADLVWAGHGLHAVSNIRALLSQWHGALAVDGFVLFSCWGPDSLLELRRMYAAEGWGPVTPEWVDLHDLGDLLVETGFAEPVMDQERLTLTWSDADALWRDLAALGGNVHVQRFAGLRTPRWRQAWRAAADRHLRGPDGRLSLTLEFVVGHAIKPQPRLSVAPETRVSLDQLRDELRKPRA